MGDSDIRRAYRQRNIAYAVAVACLIALIVSRSISRTPNDNTRSTQQIASSDLAVGGDSHAAREMQLDSFEDGEARNDAGNNGQENQETDAAEVSEQLLPGRVPSDETGEAPNSTGPSPIQSFFSAKRWQEHPMFLNAQYTAEMRDPQWAGYAELQIEDFVARHPYAGAYQDQWLDCRTTLCQFYAEVDPSMAGVLQQAVGNIDPFHALRHESLSTEIETAASSFGRNEDTGRLNMVITIRRRGGD